MVTFVVIATADLLGGSTPSWARPFAAVSARRRARGVRPRAARGGGAWKRTVLRHQAAVGKSPAAITIAISSSPMSSPVMSPVHKGAGVPGADAQSPDHVNAHAERDLAHRPRAVRGRGRARVAGGVPARLVSFPWSAPACDTLDGRYSRMSGKGSRRSARSWIPRSTAWKRASCSPRSPCYFSKQGRRSGGRRMSSIAVLASLMVSYTRARAEALGVECKVGIADRACARGDPLRRT